MFQGHASRFKCTYRKVVIRELFLNEGKREAERMSPVFGGIHDPREDHKLDGSLFRYSSPPMDFQWMLMPILQLSGRLLPKDSALSNVSSLMRSLHQSGLLVLLASQIA